MANRKKAILKKEIDGELCDLMVQTKAENVLVDDTETTLDEYLSDNIAEKLDNMITGTSSARNGYLVQFDGTSGKKISEAGRFPGSHTFYDTPTQLVLATELGVANYVNEQTNPLNERLESVEFTKMNTVKAVQPGQEGSLIALGDLSGTSVRTTNRYPGNATFQQIPSFMTLATEEGVAKYVSDALANHKRIAVLRNVDEDAYLNRWFKFASHEDLADTENYSMIFHVMKISDADSFNGILACHFHNNEDTKPRFEWIALSSRDEIHIDNFLSNFTMVYGRDTETGLASYYLYCQTNNNQDTYIFDLISEHGSKAEGHSDAAKPVLHSANHTADGEGSPAGVGQWALTSTFANTLMSPKIRNDISAATDRIMYFEEKPLSSLYNINGIEGVGFADEHTFVFPSGNFCGHNQYGTFLINIDSSVTFREGASLQFMTPSGYVSGLTTGETPNGNTVGWFFADNGIRKCFINGLGLYEWNPLHGEIDTLKSHIEQLEGKITSMEEALNSSP